MSEEWEISAGTPDVVESQGAILTLEWPLNRRPDPEWEQFLIYSGTPKSGSMTFVSHDPKVVGSKIRMVVEDRDIEAAVRYVEQSIPLANQKFETQVLSRRRREAERAQAQQAADAARLEQVRDRLRKASGSTEV